MNLIDEAIKKCFEYYDFLDEYDKLYINTAGNSENILSDEEIVSAASVFSGIKKSDGHYYVFQNALTSKVYDKNTAVGYDVYISGNEFTFVLVINYNGDKFISPLNDIANKYSGENRYTRGINIYDYSDLKRIFRNLCIGGNILRKYIVDMSCCEYYKFLTQTDFLSEYEKLNLLCTRDKTEFSINNFSVLSMLREYENISAIYISSENFFRGQKVIGDVEIGYNIEIRYKTLINFIIWGKRNDDTIFAEPSVEILVRNHGSGKKLKSLDFRSIDELKGIFDFMMKYLDVLGSFFENDVQGDKI